MNPLILQLKKLTLLYFTVFAFGCLAFLPQTQAVSPPDTPDPGSITPTNTADGDSALLGATGLYNSAFGFLALLSNGSANYNTGVGAGALLLNTANENTATGAAALVSNTIGTGNTANGAFALFSNTTGGSNTAVGLSALQSNTTGIFNTANGATALFSNTTGNNNTGIGVGALLNNITNSNNTGVGTGALAGNSGDGNTGVGAAALNAPNTGQGNTAVGAEALLLNTGNLNTAIGLDTLISNTAGANNTAVGAGTHAGPAGAAALGSNTTGANNTAVGAVSGASNAALGANTTGFSNTAIGASALGSNTTGNDNIAVGKEAGFLLTTGDNNIDIGNTGVADEANTIRVGTVGTQTNTFIAGISGVTVAGGVSVIVDADGHLGTVSSSGRFKDEIKPMNKVSEAILALKPVTFRYKKELDPNGIPQFGLVAEEVAKVNPDLVVRDKNGEIYTVRYEAVNAMLLNEFLKEHRIVQEQQKEINALKGELKEQMALIQKVNDKVELNKAAPQAVLNNR